MGRKRRTRTARSHPAGSLARGRRFGFIRSTHIAQLCEAKILAMQSRVEKGISAAGRIGCRVESIGQRTVCLRKARGMLQRELAQQAGIAPKSLSEIERGIVNPRVRTILKIVAAVGGGRRVASDVKVPGRRIRLLRDLHLLTQVECAALIGASRDQLADWEVGKIVPGLAALRRAGAAFGVSLDYFLWQNNADELVAKQHAAAIREVGALIRRLCETRGLSLSEVERRAGLGPRTTGRSHLSQIIAGRKKPLGRTLMRLAKVFGVGTLTSRRARLERKLLSSVARQAQVAGGGV
jgi:transcriptional regulator with XRE-family HTH domain